MSVHLKKKVKRSIFSNRFGLLGAYQAFYEHHLLQTHTPSQISWIGSLQAFLFLFGGVVAGPLYDYGYLRPLICMGSFLVVFGMMMTSLCSAYWQVILAQGLVIGLGNGCLFVPSTAVIQPYFTKRRALAMGIAITGGNVGELISGW
jgi:MFS family permease